MNTVKISSKSVKMIAHRGLSGIERENTCPAFVAAGNRSYFGIETDVHMTKDGKFVIMHDQTTERVSLGAHNINIEQVEHSVLENIVLPDKDGTTDRRDIRIPLLKEYISICKKYEKICILELKMIFDEASLVRMIEEIKQLDYIDNVVFISFTFESCVSVRKLLPENTVQWLIGDMPITDDIVNKLCEHKLDIDIYYKRLTPENVKMLHSKGIGVNCWTCDSKEDAEQLVSYGVDYITTNILE